MITKLEQLVEQASKVGRKKLSVACPYDGHTMAAVERARSQGFVDVVFTGDLERIKIAAAESDIDLSNYEVCDIPFDDAALQTACRKVSVGEADILMKGLVSSENYLKAVLNRNTGLLTLGSTINHVAVMQNPNIDRLIILVIRR
jgi:phosphate butyryltransferase